MIDVQDAETADRRSERTEVRLGDISLLVDDTDLRYIRWQQLEVIRRVYVTVRDESWETPDADLHEIVADSDEEQWNLSAQATSDSSTVSVAWEVHASASNEGRIRYEVSFTPRQPFPYARMGLCVHFPPSLLSGLGYEAWSGSERFVGEFGSLVAPQAIVDDELMPLFPAFDRLRLEIDQVGGVELSITGDLLEMEDQRNWCDGSFKAYCTPLSLPRPHQANPDRPITQRIEISVYPHTRTSPRRRRSAETEITIGLPTGTHVPPIGTVLRDIAAEEGVVESLQRSAIEHLRVDFWRPSDLATKLGPAAAFCDRVRLPIVPALFLSDDLTEAEEAATQLAALQQPPLRILVFPSDAGSNRGDLTKTLRRALAGRLADRPLFGGTDSWFVEVNRSRPDSEAMDGLAWSITPQVHASDSLSVVEGLEAHAAQINTARAFAPHLQVAVGPITLRPRYNPHAPNALTHALQPQPSTIDPRQTKPFAAAWTVGSLRALAESGVTSTTYYEAVGPRGIMDTSGRLYPVGQVLATAGDWNNRPVFQTSSDLLRAQALVVSGSADDRAPQSLLVANLIEDEQRIRIGPLPAASASVRTLTEARPADPITIAIQDRQLNLELGAYEVASVEISAAR